MRLGGVSRAARRVLTLAAIGGWAGLALFHAWLFWVQWHDGRLGDPIIAAKWAGSLLLLAALAMLHRSGRALVFGRQGLVVWTLVALVHVGASQPASLAADPASSPGILVVVPGLAGALLGAGAALIAAARRARRRGVRIRPTPPRALRSARCSPFALTGPHGLRAPPLAIA